MSEEIQVTVAAWKVIGSVLGPAGLLGWLGKKEAKRIDKDIAALKDGVAHHG